MAEFNIVLLLPTETGALNIVYPFTKWENVLDAPDFAAIQEAIKQLQAEGTGQTGTVAASFDNLLAFPGCTRLTPEKNENTYTEQIVTTEGEVLRAERTTVINDDESYTETYIFYEDDGETIKEQYTVLTSKDENGTWREVVTKGVIA